MTFDKGGKTLQIVRPYDDGTKTSGTGKVKQLCKGECCGGMFRWERHTLLPCGCHGLIHECTCKVHDIQCRSCRRIFVQSGIDWYEVEDPHKKEAQG